jgi:hypothetical protein
MTMIIINQHPRLPQRCGRAQYPLRSDGVIQRGAALRDRRPRWRSRQHRTGPGARVRRGLQETTRQRPHRRRQNGSPRGSGGASSATHWRRATGMMTTQRRQPRRPRPQPRRWRRRNARGRWPRAPPHRRRRPLPRASPRDPGPRVLRARCGPRERGAWRPARAADGAWACRRRRRRRQHRLSGWRHRQRCSATAHTRTGPCQSARGRPRTACAGRSQHWSPRPTGRG